MTTIGKYKINSQIGIGGMGVVYEAADDKGQVVALKICQDKDESSIRRFKREIRIQQSLSHKNILPIFDIQLDGTEPYFTMPRAKGNVKQIASTLCGNLENVCYVFYQVCQAVTHIHQSGNYHRDIKPSNILIGYSGEVYVSDFGLAKMKNPDSSEHSSSNRFLGTFGYDAPEQIKGNEADERTDVFQLGKTFYELYTCDYPHLINTKKLPSGLAYIIQKATSPDPDDRYQKVADLKQAIETFQLSLNPGTNPIQALETYLFEIDKLQRSGMYNEELYGNFLDLLGSLEKDPDSFLTMFDRIPDQALKIFSDHISDRFEGFMATYTEVLKEYFANNNVGFHYAETVADKMALIMENTNSIPIKGNCVRNALRVAVWYNRFAAMDTFDYMIQNIKEEEDAVYVAQILNEEIDLYKELADRISESNLHPAINEIKKKTEPSPKPDVQKVPDWMKEW
jgi:serine/threonine protein kinase